MLSRQQRRAAERDTVKAKSRDAHKVVVHSVQDAPVSLKEFKKFAEFAYGKDWR